LSTGKGGKHKKIKVNPDLFKKNMGSGYLKIFSFGLVPVSGFDYVFAVVFFNLCWYFN